MARHDHTSRPPQRVAVIGDVAGHLDELRGELARLGAHPTTGALPPSLTVIQVGDLVHRGPDSDGVLALVDRYLHDQPEQWIQLVGNHEAYYLRDRAQFIWTERISPHAQDTLRRWWAGGQLRVAAAVSSPSESFLITHAGLTAGFWRKILGAPPTAEATAAALNALIGGHDDALWRSGQMLSGRRAVADTGPLWASPATELVASWRRTPLPFSQVRGHASIYDWTGRRFRGPLDIARATEVDEQAKHETTTLPGGRIVGVDPGHGRQPRLPWRAWEIERPVRIDGAP